MHHLNLNNEGLLGLWNNFKEKRMENATKPSFNRDWLFFYPGPTQPTVFSNAFIDPKKERENCFLCLWSFFDDCCKDYADDGDCDDYCYCGT